GNGTDTRNKSTNTSHHSTAAEDCRTPTAGAFLRRFPSSQRFSEINCGFWNCAGKAQLTWRFFQGGVEPRVHLTPADSRSPATLSEEKRCRAAFATAVQKSAAIASL